MRILASGQLSSIKTLLEKAESCAFLQHPAYLPSLISAYSTVQELQKAGLLKDGDNFPVTSLKKHLMLCQQAFAKADYNRDMNKGNVESLEDYFDWICKEV